MIKNNISFQALQMDHVDKLYKWMQTPHVWRWWGEGKSCSRDDIIEKYTSFTQRYKKDQDVNKPIFAFVICVDNCPIGYIQCYNAFDFPREGFEIGDLWKDHNKSLAAIDFYIGEPEYVGKGLGRNILEEFLKAHVFSRVEACLVDPDKNNNVAIKTYSKAGFSTWHELDSNILMLATKDNTKNSFAL